MPRRIEYLPTVLSYTETDHHYADYVKYVYIYGIHRTHFYFRSALTYYGIFREDRPSTKNGIELRLTRTANKKAIIINETAHSGHL